MSEMLNHLNVYLNETYYHDITKFVLKVIIYIVVLKSFSALWLIGPIR